jgi:formylglycine-generating enzyme required for sulfatase activity
MTTPFQSRAVGEVFQDFPTAPQMVVLPSGSFLIGSADDDAHTGYKKFLEQPGKTNLARQWQSLGLSQIQYAERH